MEEKTRTRLRVSAVITGLVLAFMASGFLSTVYSEHQHRQEKYDAIERQSAELDRVSVSNTAINGTMTSMLHDIPRLTLVRVSILHNGTDSLTARPIFFADNLFAAAAPGYDPGQMQTNLPLSRWSDYLDTLRTGECAYRDLNTNVSPTSAVRWKELHVTVSIICPLTNSQGHLMGAVFAAWSEGVVPPTKEEVPRMTEQVQQAAKAIAQAFESRVREY